MFPLKAHAVSPWEVNTWLALSIQYVGCSNTEDVQTLRRHFESAVREGFAELNILNPALLNDRFRARRFQLVFVSCATPEGANRADSIPYVVLSPWGRPLGTVASRLRMGRAMIGAAIDPIALKQSLLHEVLHALSFDHQPLHNDLTFLNTRHSNGLTGFEMDAVYSCAAAAIGRRVQHWGAHRYLTYNGRLRPSMAVRTCRGTRVIDGVVTPPRFTRIRPVVR